ncbi:MAG: hypothetical protein WC785_06915 [Tatlockia sp.]|jgi:hypothetical protein
MRKIQIERKLFELFGYKFFVFEDFEDADLDIDNGAIYQGEDQDELINWFVINQFYSIWHDERRHNATVICACEGHLNKITRFLKTGDLPKSSYSTFNCGLRGEGRVLFIHSKASLHQFKSEINTALDVKKALPAVLIANQVLTNPNPQPSAL